MEFDPVAFYMEQVGVGLGVEDMDHSHAKIIRALAAEVERRTFARAAEICRDISARQEFHRDECAQRNERIAAGAILLRADSQGADGEKTQMTRPPILRFQCERVE